MNTIWGLFLCTVILCVTAIENKKPKTIKELGEEIRDRRNLEYSLTLPHSHVASFRSLDRRITNDGQSHNLNLYQGRSGYGSLRRSRPSLPAPPYAVQMEPMVQYSQKDPLYDAHGDNLEEGLSRNEIHAQPKILTVSDQIPENNYLSGNVYAPHHHGELPPPGPPYGPVLLPYYEHPEPIIEIIIKESNESLPPLPVAETQVYNRPKEPVQVFYVKYQQSPHGDGSDVIYDKPIPAVTPASNLEHDHHYEEHTTVAPEGLTLPPPPSTTLRAIIRPESEHYHSDSGVRVTFGSSPSEERGYKFHDTALPEGHEESAPHVAVAFPQSPLIPKSPIAPTQFQKRQQGPIRDQQPTPTQNFQQNVNYKQNQHQHAQQRIQFQGNNQSPHNFQHLPLQNSPSQPFRPVQTQFSRPPTAPLFSGPPQSPQVAHGPPQRPQTPYRPTPNFQQQRPEPPRHQPPFKQFSQRPFHQGPQPQQFNQFNEHEYLQQNYHTITTEQLEPPRDQQLPSSKPAHNFREQPRAPIQAPFPISQDEYNKRYQDQVQHFQQQDQRNRQRPALLPTPQPNQNGKFEQQQKQHQKIQSHNQVSISQSQSLNQHNTLHHHQQFNPQQVRPQPLPQLPQPQPPQQIHHSPQQIQHGPQQIHHAPQQIHHSPQQIQHAPQQIQHAPQQIQHAPQQIQHSPPGANFIPPGGELIASVPKYEQHLLITPGPIQNTQQSQLIQSQSLPLASPLIQGRNPSGNQEFRGLGQQQIVENNAGQGQDFLSVFEQNQREIIQLQEKLRKSEEEQQKLYALTQKSTQSTTTSSIHQVNIQNDQYYLLKNQQQNDNKQNQYVQSQARTPELKPYVAHNTNRPPLISSTGKPRIDSQPSPPPQYVSSTPNSLIEKSAEKKEKKKPVEFELPDEVPDDLRQQLIASGILDNAQISILDYDQVGDIPLESLPPDQLANFYGAGGGLQIAGSSPARAVVKTTGEIVKSSPIIDDSDAESDQEKAGSENIRRYVDAYGKKRDVEMKVVHFDPNTAKGSKVAEKYVQEGAKQVDPVSLHDQKYNRYLPLKVSGAQFPLPDVPELKGRKVTSVVVLAPVNYDFSKSEKEGGRSERAASNKMKGVNFIAGDALKRLVKTPTIDNYKKWLEKENSTSPDLQSVVLLVTGTNDDKEENKEIFMYDVATQTVSKLSGELSTAFVEVAETNAQSKDFDQLTLADAGMVESSVKVVAETKTQTPKSVPKESKPSNHKPVYSEVDAKKHAVVDKSSSSKQKTQDYGNKIATSSTTERSISARKTIDDNSHEESKPVNQVLISSGYSRMKMGRALQADDNN